MFRGYAGRRCEVKQRCRAMKPQSSEDLPGPGPRKETLRDPRRDRQGCRHYRWLRRDLVPARAARSTSRQNRAISVATTRGSPNGLRVARGASLVHRPSSASPTPRGGLGRGELGH
jgi:hypothetical protein